MIPLSPLLLTFAFLNQGTEPPRAVVRHATAAIEGDSADAPRARWTRAAERTPPDRTALLGLATLARLTYDYPAADSLYARVATDSGPVDAVRTYALLGRGLSARARGAMRQADASFERAWMDGGRAGDTTAASEALILLATTRARTAGPAAADSLFRTAEALARRDTALLAAYHCGRAEMLALSYRAAGDEARAGAAFAERVGDGRLRAQCLHLAAADLMRQGNMVGASRLFAEVADERRRLRDRSGLASTLQWRGATMNVGGWLQEASRDLEEAVVEGRASSNHSAEAWALGNLASVSMSVGDAVAAAAYADSAAREFASQGDRYGEAGPHVAEGAIALSLGQLDRARAAYEKALALYEPLGFAGGTLICHVGLAHVAMRRGDWAEAARQLDAAERAGRVAGQVAMLRGLRYHRAILDMRRGRLAAADRVLAQQLYDVRETAKNFPADAQPNWEYFDATRLAEVRARAGNLRQAEDLALSAADALDRWRATLNRRELRLQAYQVSEDQSDPDLGLATVIALLAGAQRTEPAFALAERLRARELLDHLARAEGMGAVDTTSDTTRHTARLGGVATRAEIAAALPDRQTAVFEFVTGRGGEPTTLLVLTRDTLLAYVLTAVDSLEPLVDRLNALLESNADPRQLARELGARLLDSAVARLPAAISRLVVVPDGALHRVPFDALVLADNQFVVQRFALGVAPSATVAARLWRAHPAAGAAGVLAFADPSTERAVATDVARSGTAELASLPRLRGSRDEARRVARFADGSTVRVGRQASEAWLKTAPLSDYRVLHFATHARVDEATLSGTAIALAPGGGEDGFVGPGELGNLRLDADLVVLSACRTGGGVVVRGEGIVGLAAPLIEAGARTIALTRWSIGDRQTVAFIEAFYRALADHQPAVDALRSAKLDAIARGAAPAEWAAFTIVGDPTTTVPLKIPTPERPLYWWAGVVALTALLGVTALRFATRRRQSHPADSTATRAR